MAGELHWQVTIRLLDPPLHEFLPTAEATDAIETLATESGMSKERVLEKIHSLHEVPASTIFPTSNYSEHFTRPFFEAQTTEYLSHVRMLDFGHFSARVCSLCLLTPYSRARAYPAGESHAWSAGLSPRRRPSRDIRDAGQHCSITAAGDEYGYAVSCITVDSLQSDAMQDTVDSLQSDAIMGCSPAFSDRLLCFLHRCVLS